MEDLDYPKLDPACLYHAILSIYVELINANFVFPYICIFLHYLDLSMLVNMKLDVTG